MYKEVIISIIIIAVIFVGDFFMQKYTKKSVENLSKKFEVLKSNLKEKNNEESLTLIKEIEDALNNRHNKLAYYIEHDEIEKVETAFTVCKSFVESESYELAISELDKTVFVLEHIADKYSFNLENIF